MKKYLFFILIVLFIWGCETKQSMKKNTLLPKELRAFAIRTAKTIEAKDTLTSAKDGGYGFKKIAKELGYQTNVPKKEDLKYFGDNRARKGGVLTTILPRYPQTFRTEGKNSTYTENSDLKSMLYESLLDMHPVTLKYIPSLATHWKISKDKMQFWFRINPDARWSDGKQVTTADVIATYDLLMDETILSPSDQLIYSKYERPVAISKYIVSVKCKVLNWRNLLYFGVSMSILPSHYLKGLSGTEYLKKYQFKVLPGTGPYTMLEKDFRNQVSYAVTRRLDYWDKDNPAKKYLYNFDKIKFLVVKDNPTLEFEKFKKGEQDYYTVSQARRWIEDTNFDAVKNGWMQKRKVFSQRPSGTSGYAFNLLRSPFNDRRIRYAFTYLLNREKMNKEMYYNEYLLQNSLYSGSIYENPNNEQIHYNPTKATELLAEAGYKKRNKDGWLVNDKGEVLRVEIGIPKSIDYMVTPFQQMLKEYGIDLQIKFVDSNALWNMRMEKNFTLTYISYSGLVFPNPETSFNSELAEKKNNNNIYGFKNKHVDELLKKYDVEFSQKGRIKIIREIDGIVADTRVAIWTIFRPYMRILFWNKFGYPDYMFSRFSGDYTSIYAYWWFDPQKVKTLKNAIKNKTILPQGKINVMYWPDFVKQERAKEGEKNKKTAKNN